MPTYVDSNAAGANDGTSWTDAYTSVSSTTGVAAGTEIRCAYNHVDGAGAHLSLNWSNGTNAAPIVLISADPADGSYRAGAEIGTGGTASNHILTLQGEIRAYGITFSCRRNIQFNGVTYGGLSVFDDCNFVVEAAVPDFLQNYWLGTSTNNSRFQFNNCTFDQSALTGTGGAGFTTKGTVNVCFCDCDIQLGSGGTLLTFGHNVWRYCGIEFIDCGLTDIDTLTDGVATYSNTALFRRCSLKSGYAIGDGASAGSDMRVSVEQCAVGTISVPALGVTSENQYFGTVTQTLSKYRTGGADDSFQANAFSVEMATNANALEIHSPIRFTMTKRVVAADSSPTGATARGLVTSTRCAPLATPSALTTDSSSTWNGTGVGTKQKVDVTIGDYTLTVYVASGGTLNNDDFWVVVHAPDQVGGLVIVEVFLAKPSTTVYVCPKVSVA